MEQRKAARGWKREEEYTAVIVNRYGLGTPRFVYG